jgi:hypothetical protein
MQEHGRAPRLQQAHICIAYVHSGWRRWPECYVSTKEGTGVMHTGIMAQEWQFSEPQHMQDTGCVHKVCPHLITFTWVSTPKHHTVL